MGNITNGIEDVDIAIVHYFTTTHLALMAATASPAELLIAAASV
jgi:hypothetical protein